MSFWNEDQPITGNPQDAFTKAFSGTIPDNTMATACIESALNDEYNGIKTIKVEWRLTDGDFKGKHVFQKLKVFDTEPKARHKAKNMLKLLFTMFHVKQLNPDSFPTDQDLAQMVQRHAGIRIQEWVMDMPDGTVGSGNYVSEVHQPTNFVCVTGKHKEAPLVPPKHYGASTTKNAPPEFIDSDLPF